MSIPDTNIGKWVSWLAAVITISVFIVKDYWGFADNYVEIINAATISGLLIFFVLYAMVRELMISRKEKYANINSHRHHCIHLIRDFMTYLEKFKVNSVTDDKIKELESKTAIFLTRILDEFAAIFSMLTGTKCRATIKAIYQKDGRLYVFTLARDDKSRQINWRLDKERLEKNQDPIEENEDFDMLYANYGPNSRYYFCNDLTTKRNYRSSSFIAYGKEPPEFITLKSRILSFLTSRDDWPLPYRSTIVWPIQQCPNPEIPIDKPQCIGFLSIDSESRNVFRERWDWEIGAEVADCLFHALKNILPIYQKRKEEVKDD